MKTKIVNFCSLLALFISFTLSARADINILSEGNMRYVDADACIAGGGNPDRRAHRTYVICAGGKYDGYIAGTNEDSCELQAAAAKRLVDETTGTVDDETEYMAAAASALGACIRESATFGKDLNKTLKDLKSQCLKYSDQRSQLFTGSCYLKAAEIAIHIM